MGLRNTEIIYFSSLESWSLWCKSCIWLGFMCMQSDSLQRNDQTVRRPSHFWITFLVP
jgi:hypothetical protein